MIHNRTHVVLNDQTPYPFEKEVRDMSKIPNAYVIVIFDCCRKNLNNPLMPPSNASEMEQDKVTRNLIIINGCPPNRAVSARSTIAGEFINNLNDWIDPNGTIILPGLLRFWQPGNLGDKVIDISEDLLFFGPVPQALVPFDNVWKFMQDKMN